MNGRGNGFVRPIVAAGLCAGLLTGPASAQIGCDSDWEDIGGGLDSIWPPTPVGLALAEYDVDGAGPGAYELFLGGAFMAAGGAMTGPLARWDGFVWRSVTSSTSLSVAPGVNNVYSLCMHDPDGPEGPQKPLMIAGGQFGGLGGVGSPLVAAWDGQSWSAMPGLQQIAVWALASHDFDGSGPEPPRLIVGGNIWGPGGLQWGVWMWDGAAWHPLGNDGSRRVAMDLVSFDHDDNPATPNQLFAVFTTGTYLWQGGQWVLVPGIGGAEGPVQSLITREFPGREGLPTLVFPRGRVRVWDGFTVSTVPAPTNVSATRVAIYDPDGAGPLPPLLVVGGNRSGVWAWTGADWLKLGDQNHLVYSLFAFDEDRSGPRPPSLFVAGQVSLDGSAPLTKGVARWACPHEIERCLADVNASGTVDFADVAMILGQWGATGAHPADANRDGVVGYNDALMVLGLWSEGCTARPSPEEVESLAALAVETAPTAFEHYLRSLVAYDGSEDGGDRLRAAAAAITAP